MRVVSRQSDADLLDAIRNGDPEPYGVLQERHAPAALALARWLLPDPVEAEAAVTRTFATVLQLIRRGRGPESAFRPYLLTALRLTIAGEADGADPARPYVDPALAGIERSLMARTFFAMPERWRLVLWHTEVEGAAPEDVAPLLGLPPDGVTALAGRARDGLRRAYLQAHMPEARVAACRRALGAMGGHLRGTLPPKECRWVTEHLRRCAACKIVRTELSDVDRALHVVIGPLVAGPAIGAYLEALGRARHRPQQGVAAWWRHLPAWQAGLAAAALAAVLFLLVPTVLLASSSAPAPGPAHAAAPKPAPLPPATPDGPRLDPHRVPKPPVGAPLSPVARTKGIGTGGIESGGIGPEGIGTGGIGVGALGQGGYGGRRGQGNLGGMTPIAVAGAARLAAAIEPVGGLVRGRRGLVAVRLRNTGASATARLALAVDLPPGVSARPDRHPATGWTCAARRAGPRCAHDPLPPGGTAMAFLRVTVASGAPTGRGPRLRVSAGGHWAAVSAHSGVRAAGAAARFAAQGRLTTLAAGDTLVSCDPAAPHCPAARHRVPGYRDNDLWPMRPIDQDGDHATKVSSAARLDLPQGTHVVWAGLYWSATVLPPQTGDETQWFISGLRLGGDAQDGEAQDGGAQDGGAQGGGAQGGGAHGDRAQGDRAEGGSAQGGAHGDRARGGSAQGGSAQGGSAQGGSAQGGSAQGGSAQGGSAQRGAHGDRAQGGGAQGGAHGDRAQDGGALGGRIVGGHVLDGLRLNGLRLDGSRPGEADGPRSGEAPSIRLRAPHARRYTTVRASDVSYDELPAGVAYQAFRDVTGLVRAGGGGRWWAADPPLRAGDSGHAGWALVVVVGGPRLPYGMAAVLDSATVLGGDDHRQTLDIPLAGAFAAYPATQRAARLDAVVWDGDGDLPGDRMLLDQRPLRPLGGDRDSRNAFDGSASGTPNGTFGTDVAAFRPVVRPSSVLRLTTREDVLLFGAAALTIPAAA